MSERSKEARPPKVKVSMTVEKDVADTVEDVFRQRASEALKKKERLPKMSELYEEILMEGWPKWKAKNKR